MTNTDCPTGERLLVGIAEEDRSILAHSAACPRCARAIRDTAGVLALMGSGESRQPISREVGNSRGSLSLVAAVLLVAIGLAVIPSLDPIVPTNRPEMRGGSSLGELDIEVQVAATSVSFEVRDAKGADAFVLEVWSVTRPEPMEIRFRGRRLDLDRSRLARELGESSLIFWIIRGYRNGRRIVVSPPRPLPSTRGAATRR